MGSQDPFVFMLCLHAEQSLDDRTARDEECNWSKLSLRGTNYVR